MTRGFVCEVEAYYRRGVAGAEEEAICAIETSRPGSLMFVSTNENNNQSTGSFQ